MQIRYLVGLVGGSILRGVETKVLPALNDEI